MLKIYLREKYSNWAIPNQKWLGTLHQQEMVRQFYREEAEAEQENYLMDYSLSSCLIWEISLAVCDWCP